VTTNPAFSDNVGLVGWRCSAGDEANGKLIGWFERSMGRLLHAAYKQRLDKIVALLPDRMVEEIVIIGDEVRVRRVVAR